MTKSNQILFEARNISKKYNGTIACNRVSIRLKRGQRIGIIGSNGSGKTTFLNVCCKFITPDEGDLFLDGKSYLNYPAYKLFRQGVSRSFQHVRYWKYLSVNDNLLTAHRFVNANLFSSFINRNRIKKEEENLLLKARQSMKLFEIDFLLPDNSSNSQLIKDLSPGTQRILELVRILLTNPRIIFLDEPSAGLDQNSISTLSELLRKQSQNGMGQIIVSHDLDFLQINTDYIYFMHQGEVIAEGSYEDIVKIPRIKEIYLENR